MTTRANWEWGDTAHLLERSRNNPLRSATERPSEVDEPAETRLNRARSHNSQNGVRVLPVSRATSYALEPDEQLT